jgi:hypothetical protein
VGRVRRIGVGLLCVLATTAGCNRDAPGPSPSPSAVSAPAVPPGSASATPPGSAPPPSAGPSVAPPSAGPSAPPIVTGPSKPPGGAAAAAAPPACPEVKPAIDRTLSAARITRAAPGQVTTCFVTAELHGAGVEAQILYGRDAAGGAVRAVTGTGCTATPHPVELPYPTALGCDNPTGTVHSGAGVARGGTFAVALVTVTGDAPPGARAAVTAAARKLAADVYRELA